MEEDAELQADVKHWRQHLLLRRRVLRLRLCLWNASRVHFQLTLDV